MANNGILPSQDELADKESVGRRPLVFAENRFVWVAVEALPSSQGVHVLRSEAELHPCPADPGRGDVASDGEPATSPAADDSTSLAPPPSASSAAGVACGAQGRSSGAAVESETDAGVSRAHLASDLTAEAPPPPPPPHLNSDGDARRPAATAPDAISACSEAAMTSCERGCLRSVVTSSTCSTLTSGRSSSDASTLLAGEALSDTESSADGSDCDTGSHCSGGDRPPTADTADSARQHGVDRYSDSFEAKLALLDAPGLDSLDACRLSVSVSPEPEYAASQGHYPPRIPAAGPPGTPEHVRRRHTVCEEVTATAPTPASPRSRIRSLGEQIYDVISEAVQPADDSVWDDSSAIYGDVDIDDGASLSTEHARRRPSSDSSWSEEFESLSEPEPEPAGDWSGQQRAPPAVTPPPAADTSIGGGLRQLLRRKRRTPPKSTANGQPPISTVAVDSAPGHPTALVTCDGSEVPHGASDLPGVRSDPLGASDMPVSVVRRTNSAGKPRARRNDSSDRALTRKDSQERASGRKDSDDGEGRLSRWFSLRKSNHYDLSERSRSLAKMSSVTEEAAAAAELLFHRRQQAPELPPPPAALSAQQLTRRHILQTIVHSENNYVASLTSLVNDYKKVLEELHPPLVNAAKVGVIFRRLPEILQCHTLFRIALAEAVRRWDAEERIGDVFVASFSKAVVLDIYSEFINNFSVSMETIKLEAKRKSAFAEFLRLRQMGCADRLSLFGLMVKPVQRFPQFILLLQDLLKHTPHGHHDRMSLQLALTQLESLAEMLNERKRESEQFKAFRETLRRLNGKFSPRSLADAGRYLLREDDVTRLEFGTHGSITRSKRRRLFLLNDLLVCVSVSGRQSTGDEAAAAGAERLTLKWSVPLAEVHVEEASTSLTLSHVLTASGGRPLSTAAGAAGRGADQLPGELSNVGQLCQKMSDLMHDYEVVSRIAALVGSLHGQYPGLTTAAVQEISGGIQRSIRRKDEEIAWLDDCCLQLAVRRGSRAEQHFTFQLPSPAKKREWTTDLRLAQLALDGNNSPAWDVPEREQRGPARLPLFVSGTSVPGAPSIADGGAGDGSAAVCGCYYSATVVKPTQRSRRQSYLWLVTAAGGGSSVVIYTVQQVGFREVHRFELVDERVTAMEHVPGEWTEPADGAGAGAGAVWLATEGHSSGPRLLQYAAAPPSEQGRLLTALALRSPARRLVALGGCVWAALEAGCVAALPLERDTAEPALMVPLGPGPVTCLLPIAGCLYAGCGRKVSVVDVVTREVTKSFTVQEHESCGDVHLLAHSGIGLWISLAHSATICLYHTETFRHLQDINVASNVSRVVGEWARGQVAVTALLAGRGLLWVGTSVGATLTIPLPRLEGVPIISGRGNVSYHAHCGPVTFLHVLSEGGVPRAAQLASAAHRRPAIQEEETAPAPAAGGAALEKRRSDTSLSDSRRSVRLQPRLSSPSLVRRRSREHVSRRLSRTLPRGLGAGLSVSSAGSDDVYGLYGELLNVPGFEESAELPELSAPLRRSDPELAGLPDRLATLDRRLQARRGRPRSLDLSCWSVDSRGSAHTSGSSSEGDRAHSAPASRVQSFRTDDAAAAAAAPAPAAERRGQRAGAAAAGGGPRSVLTVTAGRGYTNWADQQRRSSAAAAASDRQTHIVLWEMKL